MVVVRGYDADGFIINDPGTSAGNSVHYSFAALQDASADWNSAAMSIDPTIKIALVLSR
jgi:hypothetical protein